MASKKTTPARTPKALADALEKHLQKGPIKTRMRHSLACESEDEAVLVAHEMKKRGWKAEPDVGLVMQGDKLTTPHIVRITGRRKEKANG